MAGLWGIIHTTCVFYRFTLIMLGEQHYGNLSRAMVWWYGTITKTKGCWMDVWKLFGFLFFRRGMVWYPYISSSTGPTCADVPLTNSFISFSTTSHTV